MREEKLKGEGVAAKIFIKPVAMGFSNELLIVLRPETRVLLPVGTVLRELVCHA